MAGTHYIVWALPWRPLGHEAHGYEVTVVTARASIFEAALLARDIRRAFECAAWITREQQPAHDAGADITGGWARS